MTDRELMQQALEKLEFFTHMKSVSEDTGRLIAALRQALEQPAQQEPVAYSYTSRITGAQGFSHHPMPRFVDSESWDIRPLYTSPPQRTWVGLTDEQLHKIIRSGEYDSMEEFAKAIEAKLKEKNT